MKDKIVVVFTKFWFDVVVFDSIGQQLDGNDNCNS